MAAWSAGGSNRDSLLTEGSGSRPPKPTKFSVGVGGGLPYLPFGAVLVSGPILDSACDASGPQKRPQMEAKIVKFSIRKPSSDGALKKDPKCVKKQRFCYVPYMLQT